jgi:hypothetical protein
MRFEIVMWLLLSTCLLRTQTAEAQCGAKHSSCSGCHDGARAAAPSHEAWHDDHAFADVCPTCHGGRGDADDLGRAHEGLVDPLFNAGGQCMSCHGGDTQLFLERYTRTQSADAGASASASRASTSPSLRSRIPEKPVHGESGPNFAMIAIVVGVGAVGWFFIARNERHRRLDQAPARAGSSI